MTDDVWNKAIEIAMWAQDLDGLHELAPCRCCCGEHTFSDCEARVWNGCRSGLAPGEQDCYGDERDWQKHYETHHGMPEAEFYGYEP